MSVVQRQLLSHADHELQRDVGHESVLAEPTVPGEAARRCFDHVVKAAKSAAKEREARRRAPGDETYTAEALEAATQKHLDAVRHVKKLERERQALLTALGNRRPRPVVRAVEEDREPKAALTLAEQPYEVAVHVQRYAASCLQRAGKTRGYDLAESLVDAGQLSKGMNVLQQWQIINPDGTVSRIWRMAAVTGNNRALARLDIFGVHPEYLVTGMPQSLLSLPKEKSDPKLRLLNLREVLNRVSARLNEAGTQPETSPEDPAIRAGKIATVPTEIVIGCNKPAALEHVLRALNVNDHLRGIQPYDEDARLVALFATLVDSYASQSLLAAALAEAFPRARGADLLDLLGVRDALTANGPLDPLEPLVPAGDEVSPVVLRDIAVRAITALVFPEIPTAPETATGKRTVRDTGRFWPVVKGTLQERAWSQVNGKTAGARTRLWSAAVAQLFLHRGNILSSLGLFGVEETREGSGQDPRSLKELLLGAEAGEATAWAALVQRMAPALMHAPEPFITPGQGSEAGEGRKGVRRTPSSALASLTLAYTSKKPGHQPASPPRVRDVRPGAPRRHPAPRRRRRRPSGLLLRAPPGRGRAERGHSRDGDRPRHRGPADQVRRRQGLVRRDVPGRTRPRGTESRPQQRRGHRHHPPGKRAGQRLHISRRGAARPPRAAGHPAPGTARPSRAGRGQLPARVRRRAHPDDGL